VGALSETQCLEIWKSLGMKPSLLYGIALIHSNDRPFMVKFQLNDMVFLDELETDFVRKIGTDEFSMKIVKPRDPPPQLGENFPITIKNTKFNITLDQVNSVLGRFGVIVAKAVHVNSSENEGVKTDDVLCIVRLRKHVPSFLPAYGIKMMVRYYGQPLQCSKCMNPGHLRKKCPNDTLEWSRYVRLLVDEDILKLEQIGTWAEKLQLSVTQNESQNSDL